MQIRDISAPSDSVNGMDQNEGMKAKWLAISILVAVSAVAGAYPPFLKVFADTYPVSPSSSLGTAKCQTCHVTATGGKRNPFGTTIQDGLDNANLTDLTAALLHKVETDDSDKDGFSNLDEIKAGTRPGDPNDKPGAANPGGATASSASSQTAANELIPKHSFHPAIVHFPVALFLFGVFLEFVGFWKSIVIAREVAKFNFIAGALSALPSAITGLVAANRLGYALTAGTPAFTHLVVALFATAVMGGVAFIRFRSEPKSIGYIFLMLIAAAAVGFTGHLGSVMVYG